MEEQLNLILKKLEKLDVLEKRFDSLEKRFDALDSRMDSLEKRFDALETRMDALEKKFSAQETRMDSLEKRFGALETRMDSLDKKFSAQETRMDSLENGQKELFQIVSAIRDRQEETDAKLDTMALDIHTMKGELTAVKEQTTINTEKITETHSVVNEIQITLQKHDQTIDLLSRRSIDIEAEVRKIKQ